jgi:hypothetical protein
MGKRDREIGIYAVFAYLQLRVEESEIIEINNVGELLGIRVIADEASVTFAPNTCRRQPQVTLDEVNITRY